MSINRREFLTIAAATIQIGALGWFARATSEDAPSPIDLSLLSEKIGRSYLSLHPKERELPRLKATLHFLSGGDEQEIRAALQRDIHHDYAQGHVFKYEGWVVSRTEGRLCAYKYLAS